MVELVVGDMGMSIPTDEAIRQLELKDTEKVDYLYVNLDTLIRNAMGSTDTSSMTTLKQVEAQVIKDIFLITEHMQEVHEVPILVYYCDYQNELPRVKGFSGSEFKLPRTEKQIHKDNFHKTVVSNLLKLKDLEPLIVRHEAPLRPGKVVLLNNSIIVLTHVMVDLVDYHYFDTIRLLESRTGALKHTSRLYGKVNSPDDKKEFIPFNSITLQVYGDNSGLFQPIDIRLRRQFTQLAVDKKFNPNTTVDRINFCLKEQQDPALKELMKFYH